MLGGLNNTRAARAAAARPCRQFRQRAHPDLLPQPRLSADARRDEGVLRRQARRADRRGGLSRLHRAGDQHELRRADIQTRIHGKGALPKAGEYTAEVVLTRARRVPRRRGPAASNADRDRREGGSHCRPQGRRRATWSVADLRPRPPKFCTGCPERPVFAALKLAQREIGPTHISADIGCHAFATFAPFNLGNSILGYGMSLASRGGGGAELRQARPISVMGDGGFWHNGLITGVASTVQQERRRADRDAERLHVGDRPAIHAVERRQAGRARRPAWRSRTTLRSFGVKWLRKVRTYKRRGKMVKTLKEAMRTADEGPQGHHRGGRVPARAPAPRARRGCREAGSRRARGAHQVRRRRRDLHRRSFLHPPLRLPVAHREGQSPDPLRTDPVAP